MREDQVHIGANQLGGQFGKSLVVPLRPAVLDGDVRTLDITEVAQTQADSPKPRGKRRWRCHAEESDPRYFARLLRASAEWPHRCRAAEQRDELAPPHSITSSAATSSLSGTVRPSIRAVEALMTSSNLVDCTTGRSAGLAPLRIRPA